MALFNTGNGTTPCPECGEPMGMVSWIGPKPTCYRCQNGTRTTVGPVDIDTSSTRFSLSNLDDQPCAHEQLEKSLPPNQRGGPHALVCNCPKCRIVC